MESLKLQAIALRQGGGSIIEIGRLLGVPKTTVYGWVRNIELTKEQQEQLAKNKGQRTRILGSLGNQKKCRDKREEYQRIGREDAKRGDILHAMGCMLYWGEGTKDRNSVRFSNSDVNMIRLFMRFLREIFHVPDDRILLYVNCNLGNGLSLADVEGYWITATGLTRNSLRAARIDRKEPKNEYIRTKLPYGTCNLMVHSTEIAQRIYGSIQEYSDSDITAFSK